MKKTTLIDGTKIYCISPTEGQMLYEHITGYLEHGSINVKEGDTVVDVGANIGIFGIKLSNMFNDIKILSFEPIPGTFNVLKKNATLTQNEQFQVFQWGISDKNEIANFTYYPNSPAMSTANPDIWNSDKDLLDALEKSNYLRVKDLSKNFTKVCEKLCDENKRILESLSNLEPKNNES